MSDANATRSGEEFRDDLRPVGAAVGTKAVAARRVLNAAELAPLTTLNDARSALAVLQTFALIGAAVAFALWLGPSPWFPLPISPWLVLPIIVIGVQQHALFILAHEAAHYRLSKRRWANEALGRFVGIIGGVSMCTYRVTHRLHHNNLYTNEDPDTAIHGGYPRGVAYLWKKLAQDLSGWNAWKTYAYFFGAPAINRETNRAARPLDDTSAALRAAARADRWWVVGFHLAAPLLFLAFFGAKGLAWYALLWLLPLVTVLQPILRLRAICEHGAVFDLSSPLTAARCNRTTGKLGNWLARALLFPHHVNHHLEHHLYPAVPHYHLPRLHRLLAAKGALDGAEVRDIGSTLQLIFAARAPRPASNQPATTA